MLEPPPCVPPGRPYRSARVTDELSVDGVGEASFEAAQGFSVALAGCSLSSVVGPSWSVSADLGDGHGVQAAVELAVASTGEPMAGHVTGGGCDRRGAGVGGERIG